MTARRLFALLFLVLIVSLFAVGELHLASAEDKAKETEKSKEADKPKDKAKDFEKIKELFKEVEKTKDKEPEKIKEMPKLSPDPIQELVGKNKDLVGVLVAALRDGDPEVRQTTAYTLVNLGKEAVPALTAALGDKDPELRANAAIVLGQFGKLAQDALPALLQAMKDPDPEVRRRVIYAISRIVEASSRLPSPEPVGGWAKAPGAGLIQTGGLADYRPRNPGLLSKPQVPKPLPPLERY
jgi:HEAT repeat protein